MKIGYLGPEGTFSHEALKNFLANENTPKELKELKEDNLKWHISFAYLYDDFFKVPQLKPLDKIFIPIENSVGGGVVGNLDTLVVKINEHVYPDISIENEYIQPIKLFLGSLNYNFKDITTIVSHQQPIDQSDNYLRVNFPHAHIRYTMSTKEAVKLAQQDHSIAAIASEKAFENSGLNILAKNIQDNPNNATRFFLLGRDKTKSTGYDKTSIVITLPADKAGALYEVLGILANSTPPINMTKIESRPTKDEMGEYWFFIDIEGHQDDPHIGRALEQIKAKSKEYKFLGSYPRFRR